MLSHVGRGGLTLRNKSPAQVIPSSVSSPQPGAAVDEVAVEDPVTGSGTSRRLSAAERAFFRVRATGIFLPLVAMWLILSLVAPNFLTLFNINNVLLEAAVIALMAFGSTIVLITAEIDLSVGAVVGASGVFAAYLMVNLGLAWSLAVVLALAAGVLVGLFNGFFTTVFNIPSFITTLATLGILTGASLTLTNGATVTGFPSTFQKLGLGEIGGVRAATIVAIVTLIVLQFVLKMTRLGSAFYSVGDNAEAARRAGISSLRVKTYALMICALCSAMAGLIQIAEVNAANGTYGADQLLNAIAAVVIGGTLLSGGVGSVLDTALGVLVIVTITNGLDLLNVNPYWQQAVVGVAILLAVMLDRRNRGSERGVLRARLRMLVG
jgi:ribose transport system permease protein